MTAKTHSEYLKAQFLWVDEQHRSYGVAASELMISAERVAPKRGCKNAFLDTLGSKALEFYKRRGYSKFGRLSGFSGEHERYFLCRTLEPYSVHL